MQTTSNRPCHSVGPPCTPDERDRPRRVEPARLGVHLAEELRARPRRPSGTGGARAEQRPAIGSFATRPHDRARVVLIARDQLADLLPALREALRGRLRRVLEVQADGGDLVDHQQAEPVGQLHRLFGIGVVRRAVGVGADPLEQLVVADPHRQVQPAAVHREVLVLAEAGELDRLPVQQQLVAAHRDGADADVERVGVGDALAVGERDGQRVEVRVFAGSRAAPRARAPSLRRRRRGSPGPPRCRSTGPAPCRRTRPRHRP